MSTSRNAYIARLLELYEYRRSSYTQEARDAYNLRISNTMKEANAAGHRLEKQNLQNRFNNLKRTK